MAATAVPALALDDEDDLGKSDEASSSRLSDLLDTAPGPVLSVDTVNVPEDYGPLSPLTSLDPDSEHEQDVEDDDDVPLAEKARSKASQSRAGRRAVAVPSASRNTGKQAANRGRNSHNAAARAPATYGLRSRKKAQNDKPATRKTQTKKKPSALVATAPKIKVKRGLNRLQLAKIAAEQNQAVEDEQESEDEKSDYAETVPLARDQRQDATLPRQTLHSEVDAATQTPQQPDVAVGHGALPTTTVPVPDGALAAAVAQASSTTTAPENDAVPVLFAHRSHTRLALLPIAHAALPPVLANQLLQGSEGGTTVSGIDALPTDTSSSSHAAAATTRSSPTPLTFAMNDSVALTAEATSSRSPALLSSENTALPSPAESTTRASSTGSDISFSLGPAERAKRSPRKARTAIPMFADPARYKAFAAREAKARKAEQAAKEVEKAKTTRGKGLKGKRIAAAKTSAGEPPQEVGEGRPTADDPRSVLPAADEPPPTGTPQTEADATHELQTSLALHDEVRAREESREGEGSTSSTFAHIRRVRLIVSDPPTPVPDPEPEPETALRKSTRERKAVQRFVVEVHQPKPRGPKPTPVPLDTTPRRITRAHPATYQAPHTPSAGRGKRKAGDAQLDEPRGKRARGDQSEDEEDEDEEPSLSRTRRGKRSAVNTIDERAVVNGTANEQLQVATPPVTPAKRKRGPAATRHNAPEDPDSPIKRTRTATRTPLRPATAGGIVQQLPTPAPSPAKRGRKRKAVDELQMPSPSKRAIAAPGADVEHAVNGLQLNAGASQRTWQLFGAESAVPHKHGPLPEGLRPLLWTKTRQEICENLAWFRTYQGGVYHRDGLAIGYLLGGHAAPRDAFLHDGKVIISHGGGGTAVKAVVDQATNETVKKRVLVQDQTVSKSGIHARVLRKALDIGQPLLVLADSKYALFPHTLKEEVGYYVLGWYCVKDMWAEAEKSGSGNEAHTRVKVCLQWIETQGEPWWIPQPAREVTLEPNPQGLPTPPLDAHPVTPPGLPQKVAQLSLEDLAKRAVEPVDIASCTSCKTTSKIVYDVGWMCLTPSCARFWTLPGPTTTGTDASPHGQGMQYLPSFTELVPSPPLARLYAKNTDYRPKFPELLDKENGDPTTVHFQRGGCCPDCGRVFLRSKWECWECPTPGCTEGSRLADPESE
ncbi:hypothetical protein EXIGLDRAFT_498647 [Exidia glandulosa HHB12029]|uniref:Uncharacterized protein n=1 Tax=Exidia glandulosa HHB12029 TaxID=1314781 RepID=A0A165JFG8_EXIGL|nr:hypothetical protein EXIGLDRAFT_498647 [Exidia glandulosa HHB12029]